MALGYGKPSPCSYGMRYASALVQASFASIMWRRDNKDWISRANGDIGFRLQRASSLGVFSTVMVGIKRKGTGMS